VRNLSTQTLVAVAVVALAAGRLNAASKCEGAKIKTAGKTAACRLGLDATQASKGIAKDPFKDQACKDKMSSAFGKLDAKVPNDCLTPGDLVRVRNEVDTREDDIERALSPGAPPAISKCQGAKLKGAGKYAACVAGVKATTIAKGLPMDDPVKLAKCGTTLTNVFQKAEAPVPNDCATTGDKDAIKKELDLFIGALLSDRAACDPIVGGQPIADTYQAQGVAGPKICILGSPINALGSCANDGDCGCPTFPTTPCGSCMQTPWIQAGGVAFPFPPGMAVKYTVTTPDAPPTCSHSSCVPCGSSVACPGTPGCVGNPACQFANCCSTPGFTVPSFFLPALANACVRLDQRSCGTGVVNTSNPQSGDNEVIKTGDTSDPGLDCTYGPGDPAPKSCDPMAANNAGDDAFGKVVRTLGNGSADPSGSHSRLVIPVTATAWMGDTDGCPSPPCTANKCNGGTGTKSCVTDADCNATFDAGETFLTQIQLDFDLSTAGATGSFTDLNGDGCALVGGGFGGGDPGPRSVASPAVSQSAYGGSPFVMGSASLSFPGSGGFMDNGAIAIFPFGPPSVVASQSCTCSPGSGCF
jgi:hypothetical protein